MRRSSTARHPPSPLTGQPADTRQRLFDAGLLLFARQGFKQTSIRDLTQLAQANLAAIRYHFRDKAGLHRAVFFADQAELHSEIAGFAAPGLTLAETVAGFLRHFIEPLTQGDCSSLCTLLRCREMIEPTGLWQEDIEQRIAPMHAAMVLALGAHFGLAPARARKDLGLHALVCDLAALGIYLHVGADVVNHIAPALRGTPAAWARAHQRLLRNGLALVAAEAQTRGWACPDASVPDGAVPPRSAPRRARRATPSSRSLSSGS